MEKAYKTLKNLYQKLRQKRGISFEHNKLAKIEKIIQGKSGTIIDEIQEAIK